MTSPLQERPLLVSPGLAATIGLPAALLYQLLWEWRALQPVRQSDDGDWHLVNRQQLAELLPFWSDSETEQYLRELQEKGMIRIGSALGIGASNVRIAFNDQNDGGAANAPISRQTQAAAPATAQASSAPRQPEPQSRPAVQRRGFHAGNATAIPSNWRPDQGTLDYLQRFHGIEADFIEQALPEFITYWRESGDARASWNSTFTHHMVRRWQKARNAREEEARTLPMSRDWQPSGDCMDILTRSGIDRNFIADSIPEFVLKWREDGSAERNWNTRFIQHVRRQWAYYRNAMGGETEPSRIRPDWQPDAAVFDILAMADIPAEFARKQVPEFVLYWRDSKQMQRSWNSKFLQHVKFRWAQSHQLDQQHARRQQSNRANSQDLASSFQRLTDRSWAEGFLGQSGSDG